jgi:hypothetical protein
MPLSKHQRRSAYDGQVKYSQDKARLGGTQTLVQTPNASEKSLACANGRAVRLCLLSRSATTLDERELILGGGSNWRQPFVR